MVRIKEAIVVEGRYDKNTLSQIVDAPILETAGFGIFKDKKQMALLRQVLLFLPLVVLLPTVFAVPVQGVFYAQMFTDLIVLLIGIVLLAKAFANIRKEEKSLA